MRRTAAPALAVDTTNLDAPSRQRVQVYNDVDIDITDRDIDYTNTDLPTMGRVVDGRSYHHQHHHLDNNNNNYLHYDNNNGDDSQNQHYQYSHYPPPNHYQEHSQQQHLAYDLSVTPRHSFDSGYTATRTPAFEAQNLPPVPPYPYPYPQSKAGVAPMYDNSHNPASTSGKPPLPLPDSKPPLPAPDSGGGADDRPTSPTSSKASRTGGEDDNNAPPTPSIILLFSFLSRRHVLFLLLPALLSSLISGGIAPFMTFVVGQAFDAFAKYPVSPLVPTDQDKRDLLKGVGIAALSLVGLAFGSLAMGSVTSCLWIWVGEVNVGEVRKRLFWGVVGKEMGWFDSRMGEENQVQVTKKEEEEGEEEEGPVGAGGLMAKFTRETDDIRQATSLASGLLIQHLTTTLTCLILAFVQSPLLTLVILSSVPLLVIVQGISQGLASPLLNAERHSLAVSATLVERSLSAITTLKAFNASSRTLTLASTTFTTLLTHAKRLSAVWGFTSALSQFIMMSMFIQGFWFGSKLVREGRTSPGEVMSVFWACLIATSNLQMCVPQAILVVRGKVAVGGLWGMLGDAPVVPPGDAGNAGGEEMKPPVSPATTATTFAYPASPASGLRKLSLASKYPLPTPHHHHQHKLRKIVPVRCHGELSIHGVTFAYPTRPDVKVLKDVEMYLPSREMTFIVGASGSGKSSVGALLCGMYEVGCVSSNKGTISLDDQDLSYLDPEWVRAKVMGLTQGGGVILEGRSVWENIVCVVRDRTPTRQEVEEACRAALIHDFIRDLPDGYETILGGSYDETDESGKTKGGITLSGGQKQRLGFARARLRNPEVLVLDEATSALDPTSRILVFEALKVWRRNKTTIVITHDLSQISKEDFVYVLKGGVVVERGFRGDLEGVRVVGYDGYEHGQGQGQEGGDGDGRGEFRKMLESQKLTGGYLPEKDLDALPLHAARPLSPSAGVNDFFSDDDDEDDEDEKRSGRRKSKDKKGTKTQSFIRPITFGNWMLDVIAELVGSGSGDGTNSNPTKGGVASHAGQEKEKRQSGSGWWMNYDPASPSYPHYAFGQRPPRPELAASAEAEARAEGGHGLVVPMRERRPSSAIVESPTRTSFGYGLSPTSTFAPSGHGYLSPVPPGSVSGHGHGYGYNGYNGSVRGGQGWEDRKSKRLSLQFVPATPSSATFTLGTKRSSLGGLTKRGSGASASYWYKGSEAKVVEDNENEVRDEEVEEEERFEEDKEAVKKSGGVARDGRAGVGRQPRSAVEEVEVRVGDEKGARRRHGPYQSRDEEDTKEDVLPEQEQPPAFWALLFKVIPGIPHKPLLLLGLLTCVLSGAMTPIFSFLLSRLLFEVSIGAQNVSVINTFGGIVLGIAALDGLFLGLKYFIMEFCGIAWVTHLRNLSFENLLKQDTKFFDQKPRNSPARLVQILVKDAEDSRNLVAVVIGQCLVVATMLGVGLVWAMVRGWELTLVGVGVAPVFGVIMSVQTTLVGRCEVRNKRAREALAKTYFDTIVNIRSIRALSLTHVYARDFEEGRERALRTGVKGAFVEGCTYGIASGLIYLAEGLLFYVGAVLIVKGRYSYLQMVEVLNLVVFSVTIGSQLMAFTERIAKSVQATSDLYKLVSLSTDTDESRGSLRPPLNGPITFRNVTFAYPTRPEVNVLRNLSLRIREGECVAIVGSSGCGKSTLAGLVQRLYEVEDGGEEGGGAIKINGVNVKDVDVDYLRSHISVVSQHPHLFDASVAENIRFGASSPSSDPSPFYTSTSGPITQEDIERAAKQANVHEFIMGLPQGYDTVIGENAALISGGQAQRIQIARALVRPQTSVLVLDECTSALDGENQAVVMDTIRSLVQGPSSSPLSSYDKEKKLTTIMVTHNVEIMKMCDRVVVLGDGEVKEQGTFEELVRRKGVFASLAAGGEWVG